MRKIVISVNGKKEFFTSDKKAQDFLSDLAESYRKHPWFFNWVNLEHLKFEISPSGNVAPYSQRGKAMKKRIEKLEKERMLFFAANPGLQKPEPIKIEIEKI